MDRACHAVCKKRLLVELGGGSLLARENMPGCETRFRIYFGVMNRAYSVATTCSRIYRRRRYASILLEINHDAFSHAPCNTLRTKMHGAFYAPGHSPRYPWTRQCRITKKLLNPVTEPTMILVLNEVYHLPIIDTFDKRQLL